MKTKKIKSLIFLISTICIFALLSVSYEAFSFNFGDTFTVDVNKIIAIGKSVKKALEDFNEEEQYYIGRSVGASLLANYELHNPGDLQSYVSSIGQTLALASDRPETFKGYHFIVLDEPDKVNAFAVPSGFIFITTGIIFKTSNEDELAGILAHEIAHIVLGHPVDSISKVYRDQLKKDILGLATDQISTEMKNKQLGLLVNGLNQISGIIVDTAAKGYSRDKEDDADKEAVKIIISAGYDPNAFSSALEKLNPIGTGKSGTHGEPAKRSKHVTSIINEMKTIPAIANERSDRFSQLMEHSS